MSGVSAPHHARRTSARFSLLRRRLVGAPEPARRCALAAAIALGAYLAFFPIARTVTFAVGRFPDRLVIAGFNGDERDAGVTYRWTRTAASIRIPGYGGVRAAHIEVVARNGRGQRIETPFTLDIGGVPVPVGAIERFTPVLADLRTSGGGADLTVGVRTQRYTPPSGDPRVLGVQIAQVRVEPLRQSWWRGALGGWPWALRFVVLAVAFALVVPLPASGGIGGGVAALVALAALVWPDTRFVLPPLLLPGALAVGVVGAIVRGRETAETLAAWWNALDRAHVARFVVGAIIGGYVIATIAVIRRVDYIGHADYADNAVRAGNIVRGQGDVVDYVVQFYRRYPQVTHPAETWPPLHVWVTAAFFRVLGISTRVAKLPNVAVMVGLLAFAAWIGAWRWTRRVGALAALLLALTPLFFEDTLFPVNDLAFTLLFAAFAVLLYRAWCEPRPAAPNIRPAWLGAMWPDIAAGTAAGLLLLAKPSGAVLILGAALAALVVSRRMGARIRWRRAVGAALTAGVWYAPWAIRNAVTFGAPFHSTESLDAWVLKYDPTQPAEGIYRVYWGRDLPHPRVLIGYGYDHFLSVQGQQFAHLWADMTNGVVISRLLIPFILIGAIVGAARRPGFGTVLAGAAAPYTLFVLLYWHYEVRYFLGFVPWLLLFAAAGIEWTYDALVTWFAGMWQRALVPLATAALLLAILAPAGQEIALRAQTQAGGNELVDAANWLKANTPEDAVVMTRNPWEITWHSGRRTVMLPLGSLEDVYAVMRQYGVTVLELDHINDPSITRDSLRPLYSFKEMPGITPRYDPGNDAWLVFTVAPPI